MVSPANRRFHDETGKRITPGRKLGEGGEGSVFLIDGHPGSVMKIWHPGRMPEEADAKLNHMVRNPVRPDLGASWHVTWPQHLVRENGITVGYTMPILDPGQSWEPIVEYYNRRAAPEHRNRIKAVNSASTTVSAWPATSPWASAPSMRPATLSAT